MIFGRGLKIFTVHVKPSEAHGLEKPVFVREGFNIAAFLFTFLWALYYRLWKVAALLFALNLCAMLLGQWHILTASGVGVLQLGLQTWIGFQANDWRRAGLTRRGYVLSDISASDNALRAEQRYFERYLATVR